MAGEISIGKFKLNKKFFWIVLAILGIFVLYFYGWYPLRSIDSDIEVIGWDKDGSHLAFAVHETKSKVSWFDLVGGGKTFSGKIVDLYVYDYLANEVSKVRIRGIPDDRLRRSFDFFGYINDEEVLAFIPDTRYVRSPGKYVAINVNSGDKREIPELDYLGAGSNLVRSVFYPKVFDKVLSSTRHGSSFPVSQVRQILEQPYPVYCIKENEHSTGGGTKGDYLLLMDKYFEIVSKIEGGCSIGSRYSVNSWPADSTFLSPGDKGVAAIRKGNIDMQGLFVNEGKSDSLHYNKLEVIPTEVRDYLKFTKMGGQDSGDLSSSRVLFKVEDSMRLFFYKNKNKLWKNPVNVLE
jgi:hypothetical protein